MSDVEAYHPEMGALAMVPEDAMFHLRQSGWLLKSEHEENQAAAQAAEAKAKGAKGAKSDEEK